MASTLRRFGYKRPPLPGPLLHRRRGNSRSGHLGHKPGPERSFINCQRSCIMKMPAWSLLRGSTRMKAESALLNRQARKIQFFKGCRRHSRDLGPMFDSLRRGSASVADSAIGQIVLKLKSEELQCQGLKDALIGGHRPRTRRNDEIAQPRREVF